MPEIPRANRSRRSRLGSSAGLAALAVAAAAVLLAPGVRTQEGSGPSGLFHDDNKTLEWRISGVEVGTHRFSPANRYWTAVDTKVVSNTVTFSGRLRAAVAPTHVTNGSLSASIRAGNQIKEVRWPDPAKDESGSLGHGFPSNFKELSFSLALDVPPGTPVSVDASAGIFGGIGEYFKLHLDAAPMPVDSSQAPPAPESPEDADGFPWELAVGGGTLGAAALAAAARLIARKAAQKPSTPDKPAGYILQLSANHLKPTLAAPAALKIDVWRVDAQAGYAPAPEAEINVQVSPTGAGVVVTPDVGHGSMLCSVSLCQGPYLTEAELHVIAVAGGSHYSATVRVELTDPLEFKGGVENGQAFMEAGKETWLTGYSASQKQWEFQPPFVYFTAPGQEQWTAPGFSPVFEQVAVTPDVLEVPSPPVSDDGGLTWTFRGVRLKDGAELTDEFVFGTGVIHLEIQCREPDPSSAASGAAAGTGFAGKAYTCGIDYKLRAAADLVVVFDPDTGRAYEGLDLAADEFVADGKDKLAFRAYLNRSDKDRTSAMASGEITAVDLPEDAKADFALQWEKDPARPGEISGTIASRRQLLASAARVRHGLQLDIKGRMPSPAGRPGAKGLEFERSFPLKPRRLYLKLWVIPGSEPGTSEAGAFLCAEDAPSHPLTNYALRVWTTVEGSGTLDVSFPDQITGEDGTCTWYLTYGGLSWDRLAGTTFHVHCGILENGEVREWTSVEIDVYRNVSKLLKAILDARDRLQLTNPRFQGASPILDWPFPDIFRGPLYNFCVSIAQLKEWADSFVVTPEMVDDRYVCRRMRDRIYSEMAVRRFGRRQADRDEGIANDSGSPASIDAVSDMNGIEISQYAIWPVHVWAGIHLSGSGPDDDPRFIDPWWRQEWSSDKTHPAALLTWRWEIANQAAVVAAVSLLTILVCKLLAPSALAAARRIETIGGMRIARWIAAKIVQIFRGQLLTLGGAEIATGGLEVVNLGIGRFLAGACNPGVAGGHYIGFNAKWLTKWAIPRQQELGVSVVEPFAAAGEETR